jgi:hypothetical protein
MSGTSQGKSKSTTNSSYSKLSSKELCAIIKQCGESNVKKLEFEGLELNFYNENETDLRLIDANARAIITSSETNPQVSVEDELNHKDQYLEELKITNPAEYEKMLFEGELEAEG